MVKKACILFVSLFLLTSPALAATINGVSFPDTVSVGGQNLTLNGGGERTDFGFDVYAAALYLKEKSTDAQKIVSADDPMDVKLHITSVMVNGDNMKSGFEKAFKDSATGDIAPLQSKIDAFTATFKGLRNDDVYDFACVPGKGVVISRNGSVVSTVPGMDFKTALYGIWFGPKPVQSSLKEKMLGQ